MNNNNYPIGISVIICTHNGSKRISDSLLALFCQNFCSDVPWEILLIDNGSTDHTTQIIREFIDKNQSDVPFKIIMEPKEGKSNALIKGYDEAKYELMLVCDDDNWLNSDYLQTVFDVFQTNSNISLLGGYGIAEFKGEVKPVWFDLYQACFACGKNHNKTGFLAPNDTSIWGAGSVIRKSMWNHLRKNGFIFINNTGPDKAFGEDVELSHAVAFAGGKLYFDEQLWFFHDVSGGRVTKENVKKQIIKSGSVMHVILMTAYHNTSKNVHNYNCVYYRMICSLIINLIVQSLKKNNVFLQRHLFHQINELITHKRKYRSIYKSVFQWVKNVKNNQFQT